MKTLKTISSSRSFLSGMAASALLSVILLPLHSAHAAPGDLDTTFDTDGKNQTTFSFPGGTSDARGNAVRVLNTDRTVVAGDYVGNFVLARYTSAGALDTTFGGSGSGKVTTDFGGSDYCFGLTSQSNGPYTWLYAAGTTSAGSGGGGFALVGYNGDGTINTSFGTSGKVITPMVAGGGGIAEAIVSQTDGKLVVAGVANDDFALARYNNNGTLDTTFGTGGKVLTNFTTDQYGTTSSDVARAVYIQGDGKIVVAGISNYKFAVARYTTAGVLDTTFGTGGKVTTAAPGSATVITTGIGIQSTGKIVLMGQFNNDFAAVRYTTAGVLDTTFGTSGIVTTNFGGNEYVYGGVIQSDDKIIIGGDTDLSKNGSFDTDFALARYTVNGALDTTFGTGGKVTTDFGGNEYIGAITISSNRLIAAGAGAGFAVARYLLSSTTPSAVKSAPATPSTSKTGSAFGS